MAKIPLKDENGQFVVKNGFVVYVEVDDDDPRVQRKPLGKVTHTR